MHLLLLPPLRDLSASSVRRETCASMLECVNDVQSLNVVLISGDAGDLPLTDLASASSLPYDTDIPEGELANSPV